MDFCGSSEYLQAIDPAKVIRVGLESAASVSGILLTTEVLVTELKDEKKIIPYAVR